MNDVKNIRNDLEVYKGSIDDIVEKTFLVSIAAFSSFEKECENKNISYKKDMLGEVAAYIVTLETK